MCGTEAMALDLPCEQDNALPELVTSPEKRTSPFFTMPPEGRETRDPLGPAGGGLRDLFELNRTVHMECALRLCHADPEIACEEVRSAGRVSRVAIVHPEVLTLYRAHIS